MPKGINLIEAADGQLFGQLASDPVLLVNTLYAVCKPQADERGVGEEEFGALLVGDTIEGAAKAGIVLNRKMLSEIAIHDPEGFKSIVAKVQTA